MRFFIALAVLACALVSASHFECEMCEVTVKVVGELLNEESGVIKVGVDAECAKLFETIPVVAEVCEDFVNKEVDVIIAELNKGTAPEHVCTEVKLC